MALNTFQYTKTQLSPNTPVNPAGVRHRRLRRHHPALFHPGWRHKVGAQQASFCVRSFVYTGPLRMRVAYTRLAIHTNPTRSHHSYRGLAVFVFALLFTLFTAYETHMTAGSAPLNQQRECAQISSKSLQLIGAESINLRMILPESVDEIVRVVFAEACIKNRAFFQLELMVSGIYYNELREFFSLLTVSACLRSLQLEKSQVLFSPFAPGELSSIFTTG